MQNLLLRSALITSSKLLFAFVGIKVFVRPHLDYGDILYDQAHNASFYQKLQSLQCNACLVVTGTLGVSSKKKLYQKVDFESLQQCCWYRKLCSFYEIFKNENPRYFFNIIPTRSPSYITRNHDNHNFFKNSFFPSIIIESKNPDPNLRNSDTFKTIILKFLRPSPNSVFKFQNHQEIKFETRLRLGLSHLCEHKIKHSFQDVLNPLCKWGFGVLAYNQTPLFHLQQ